MGIDRSRTRRPTQHARAEGAAQGTEAQHRALLDAIPDLIFRLTREGRFLDFSPAKGQEPALPPAEFLGRTVREVMPTDLAAEIMRHLEQALQTGDTQVFEYQMPVPLPNGNLHDFEGRIAVSSNDEVLAVVRDITERRRAEEALRDSEERFRRLSEATLEGIFIHDGDRILDANPQAAASHGYELSEFIGMEIWDFIAPDCHDLVRQQLRSGYEGSYEARGLRKDGTTFPMELCGKTASYKGHQVRVGVMRDISERRRAEQALRESEQRFRSLSEATLEGIVIHDGDRVLDANPQVAAMVGYEVSELIGMVPLGFVAPDYRDQVRQQILSANEEPHEVEGLRKDGSTFPVEVCAKTASYEGRQVRVGVVRDISERKRAEEAAQAAREDLEAKAEQRMVAAGRYNLTFRELTVLYLMAAGMADKEIAFQLGISSRTASKHVENVLRKMGVASRTGASMRALREGLVGDAD